MNEPDVQDHKAELIEGRISLLEVSGTAWGLLGNRDVSPLLWLLVFWLHHKHPVLLWAGLFGRNGWSGTHR